jgi:hypothetical protein
MTDKLNGCKIFHWSGKDREADTAKLADAIAAIGELFNDDGKIVRLNGAGEKVGVNLADFRDYLTERIAYVKLVARADGKWQREYAPYWFAPQPRIDTSKPGPWPEPDETTPDDKVLDEIYRRELLWRLPRVQS